MYNAEVWNSEEMRFDKHLLDIAQNQRQQHPKRAAALGQHDVLSGGSDFTMLPHTVS